MSGDLTPRSARSQGGFSLLEMLIAVMLISLVVAAIAGGVIMLMRTTQATAERQQVQHGLANFSESLKAAPYRACDTEDASAAAYQAAYQAWPSGWVPPQGMTVRVLEVAYWDRADRSFGDCGGADQGAQRLSVEVTWRGRVGNAQVVKGSR